MEEDVRRESFINRMTGAIKKEDPLAFAISIYKVVIENEFYQYCKDDEEEMNAFIEALMNKAIDMMQVAGWEDYKMFQFAEHMEELFKKVE